ncbi:hypothetical protein BGZ95_003913 [Linnemannia exigua]|uniref:F-box domain-containing protein n=1 Tax=Linnemannia exigua TaxID=604196 RepID=A0AAD4D443_9FUNG|nr:hypothetical protein BGZ95_003913 [Linnemannia exigua]
MATPPGLRNPFQLPELRCRLSRFVTLKDALSCTLVSKAWTYEFISAIWFKVDLNIHPLFTDLPANIIAKHGHHIRIAKNVVSHHQISTFAHPAINKLRHLQIETAASTKTRVQAYEIVARNNTTLQFLAIFSNSYNFYFTDQSNLYISAPSFVPLSVASPLSLSTTTFTPSNVLTTLEITQLCLTHDSLMVILEASPRLTKIRASKTYITGTPTRSFQHTGVSLLAWSLNWLFPVEQKTTGPHLLSYFPNLKAMHTWKSDPNYTIPTDRIKKELTRYCPLLTQYKLEDGTGSITSEFLTNIATNVTCITFEENCMSPEMVTAIVLHRSTLKKVSHFYTLDFAYEKDQVLPVPNNIKDLDEMLQLIPRSCVQLERLSLNSYEMDMDVMESAEWVCKDLKKLRIRVKGLDTKEQILRVIALWRAGCWRRWQEKAKRTNALVVEAEEEEEQEEVEKQLEEDYSIEARVARHLLKFEHLHWVWLGYQSWTSI